MEGLRIWHSRWEWGGGAEANTVAQHVPGFSGKKPPSGSSERVHHLGRSISYPRVLDAIKDQSHP